MRRWRPPSPACTTGAQRTPGGRGWTELQVANVLPADFADVALVGYQITFTTAAVFHGQP